jgi:hypothetical protein
LCRINSFNLKQVWARLWECAKERSEQEHRTKMGSIEKVNSTLQKKIPQIL